MKIQHKAALAMILFGITLVLPLSFSYEILSRRTLMDRELNSLKDISEEVALHIDSHIKEKINVALTLSSSPLIRDALLKSNAEFAGFQSAARNREIDSRNQRWKRTEDINDPFIQAYMSNPVAKYLKNQQMILPGRYGEIFLTNVYGAMIAATGKLTTLAHAHKYWWTASYHDGKGKIFLDDRGFDTSAQGYVLGVVVPVKDENGIIGILKCNMNVLGPMTDVIQEFSLRNPGRIKIVRTGGLIVAEQGVIPLSKRINEELVVLLRSDKAGYSIVTEEGERQLAAFSTIPTTGGRADIAFGGSRESIDHIRGNADETWHVVTFLDENEVVKSTRAKTQLILIAGIIFTFLTAVLALLLGKLAANPIVALADTAKKIGEGNFDVSTSAVSDDEIGCLAQSLNKMAENLATITVSRDELFKEVKYRKEIEQKLNQFKLTLDQTLDCVFMFAPDTLRFFYVNQGAVNQLGFKKEEFFNMTPIDIKPEFTEELFRNMVEPLINGSRNSFLFQTMHQHKNGSLIPVEIFLQFVKQPTEEYGRFLAIVRDISERRNARQRLQRVLDTVDAMIYVADMDTHEILLVNRYIKERFGDIKGRKCWEAIQAQNGPCPFCEYHNLHASGQLLTGAHVWQVQNGRNGEWYECHDESIRWVDGRIVRIQVATNITERKKVEHEREELIKELRAALSEIQVLRGILPICSFCKNIRNDEGYYEQIESYIHKHSGVDFSHTVCPICMQEYYPEQYDEIMNKNK